MEKDTITAELENLLGSEKAELAQATQLRHWYEQARQTAKVNAITIDHIARNPVNGKILFLKISPRLQPYDADRNPGKELTWNVFATGPGSCLCAVFNTSSRAEDHYVLLVQQFRTGVAEMTHEIAAGIGEDGLTLQNNALKELAQETGITMLAGDLVYKTGPAASSPNTVSERVTTFFAYKRVDAATLLKTAEIAGQHRENEIHSFGTSAQLFSLRDAFPAVTGDAKSAYALATVAIHLTHQAFRLRDYEQAEAFNEMAMQLIQPIENTAQVASSDCFKHG
jgi:hypothetical protein